MFSVIFPGQGSQSVGMGREFYDKFDIVKKLFNEADEILDFPISRLILEGPKEQLNLTENTQPAIFLVSYSIFMLVKKEFGIDLNKASYFAGHSLGEYTALSTAESLSFSDTLKILKARGKAMQNAIPKGKGGMVAVLGSEIVDIDRIIKDNKNQYECFVANDNANGQLVVSGNIQDIDKFILDLKSNNIKSIKLPVSAPFHCKLMEKATVIMREEIQKLQFKDPKNILISNVTADEIDNSSLLTDLLIKQIENKVRWRESINFMIEKGVDHFIEIGPGKVLSGLIKRINRNIKVSAINSEEDISLININD
jgi:[acyl-carrier-protein] S-malonyltransferase|tara:strand:+ start:78 stop:1010 length:933 start_codon:yes stop_codon:yes gene_type:complete